MENLYIGQRVQDLDQRLTLTEHANRAALDEVYGLRYKLPYNGVLNSHFS